MEGYKRGLFASILWSFILLLLKTLALQIMSPFIARNSKKQPIYPQGLQTLLPSIDNKSHRNHIVHSFEIKLPSPLSPSPPSSSLHSFPSSLSPSSSSTSSLMPSSPLLTPSPNAPYIDELLGTDSGAWMSSNEDVEVMWSEISENRSQPTHILKNKEKCMVAQKKYPPCHTSCVLTRHYENGRLIIVQHELEHHGYFEANRENGCLRLTYVRVDDSCFHDDDDDGMQAPSELDQNREDGLHFGADQNSKLCPDLNVYGNSSQYVHPLATVNSVA